MVKVEMAKDCDLRKDLRAGLRETQDNVDVEIGRSFMPKSSWENYSKTFQDLPDEKWEDVLRMPGWYGSKNWSQRNILPKSVPNYEQLTEMLAKAFSNQEEFKQAIAGLHRTLEGFRTANCITTNSKDLETDKQIYFFEEKVIQAAIAMLSHFDYVDQPMLDALIDCAIVDISNGANVQEIQNFLTKAKIIISQAFVSGCVMGRAASGDLSTGPLIVLTSMFTGCELMYTGYQDFWRRACHKLRLATMWMICKSYAQGVQSINSNVSITDVWLAGKDSIPPPGGLSWVRIRQAYMLVLPDLKFRIEELMHSARKKFKYPGRDLTAEIEMRSWCDVTTFDWYGVCGPISEEISVSALGALMLGYECEVLIDMCPGTSFVEYLDFVATGVDVIPHMDCKEMAAGAFAAHACGVQDFEGLSWLDEAVAKHYSEKRSQWSTRCLDGAAFLMFVGINEGSRQPALSYGEWRLKAEVNLMASHEIGGLYRHGKEDDQMSSAMLSQKDDFVSFVGTIRKLVGDAVEIEHSIGEPQGYGVTLTGHGYLLFNMMGTSSMFRWACAEPLRCESIAHSKKPQRGALTKGAEKVSHLASRRAERLGISNDFRKNNPHKAGEDCLCWTCAARPE